MQLIKLVRVGLCLVTRIRKQNGEKITVLGPGLRWSQLRAKGRVVDRGVVAPGFMLRPLIGSPDTLILPRKRVGIRGYRLGRGNREIRIQPRTGTVLRLNTEDGSDNLLNSFLSAK